MILHGVRGKRLVDCEADVEVAQKIHKLVVSQHALREMAFDHEEQRRAVDIASFDDGNEAQVLKKISSSRQYCGALVGQWREETLDSRETSQSDILKPDRVEAQHFVTELPEQDLVLRADGCKEGPLAFENGHQLLSSGLLAYVSRRARARAASARTDA